MRLRDKHNESGARLQVPPLLCGLNYLDFHDERNFRKQFARLLAKLKGDPPPRGRDVRRHTSRTDTAELLVPALPDDRESPDSEPESLLSNLLPITSMPRLVWSAPTNLKRKGDLPKGAHLPPFILRESRLLAFNDLSVGNSPFSPWVLATGTTRYAMVEWQNDPVRWRWFIELMNLSLRGHLRPEVAFDNLHKRYWFVPQGQGSVALKWGAGTKRTVVRAPKEGGNGGWIHHAASLQFETIGSSLYLSINPTYVFTLDGHSPVPDADVPGLASRWGGRERNGAILRNILLWADVVTKGKKVNTFSAGDQWVEISRLPVTVEAPVSLADDHVRVKALLCFSDAEWKLESPFGYVLGDEVNSEECEDDEL